MAAKKRSAKKKAAKRKTDAKKGKKGKGAKAGKRAKKQAGATKKKKAAKPKGPVSVTTGKGPGPAEVAARVIALLRAGNTAEVEKEWLASDIESVEGLGASVAWNGKQSVLDKYRAWEADHEVHDMQLEGPWVGATGFAVRYRVDMTQKSSGQRSQMEEIAVYTVKNGKITREEFHFRSGG